MLYSLKNREECKKFFEDICTIKEIQDLQQRLTVAKMLDEGRVYSEITEKTGASAATMSRVNKCLTYGSDGTRPCSNVSKKRKRNDTFGHSRSLRLSATAKTARKK